MLVCPEVSYPAGFPPVKTLEDEIYYLEHILPERNRKGQNLPAGYGIVVKGTDDQSLALLTSIIAMRTMC